MWIGVGDRSNLFCGDLTQRLSPTVRIDAQRKEPACYLVSGPGGFGRLRRDCSPVRAFLATLDRLYIEAGNNRRLSDVSFFTFEPHVRPRDRSLGLSARGYLFLQFEWNVGGTMVGAASKLFTIAAFLNDKSIGQGMGAALNFAAASDAYVLSDRGTWIHFANKGDLEIVVQGDRRLFNQYGVMLVNPAKHPNVKQALGQEFIDYLISPEAQKAIASYRVNGQQLFFPDANSPEA